MQHERSPELAQAGRQTALILGSPTTIRSLIPHSAHHPGLMSARSQQTGRYAAIHGLQLYYEIHGSGEPLVLLHGGGSTIDSTFGRVLPALARAHQVIAVELQAHGRTRDINRPLTFEQDADDVVALVDHLQLERASFLGFSNGGTTCLQVAIRHPTRVKKLVLASPLYKRSGAPDGFFESFKDATLDQTPVALQEAYLKVNPDPRGLKAMFHRDVARMIAFKDIDDAALKSIEAPTLVLNGDDEIVRIGHAIDLFRTLPHARLAILPGGHGDYIGEICAPDRGLTVPLLVAGMITDFFREVPPPIVATAEITSLNSAAAPGGPPLAAEALIASEKEIWRLIQQHDLAGFSEYLAEDFYDIFPDGTERSKSELLDLLRDATLKEFRLSKFRVTMLNPDAAIVTYEVDARATVQNTEVLFNNAVTAGWARRRGKWVNVSAVARTKAPGIT